MTFSGSAGDESVSVKKEMREGVLDSELERFRVRLRECWELASVLNFLNVFGQVIGMDQKISAEEIETGLIKPDKSLSHLHIMLLKGIPPVCKTLHASDVWVTVLCKKIGMWWTWVAEGEVPLTASKGQEVSVYKELDPTTRLRILKALCEIRADQDDIVSYINGEIKGGIAVSCFRKDKIGEDDNGTIYWYDGSAVTGHRLYKDVSQIESWANIEAEKCSTIPSLPCFKWETLATNLEEFHAVVDKFSSSENKIEVSIARCLETDAIPALEKIRKKEERALKKKERQELVLNSFQNSYNDGHSRRCRRPVNYTYDDYDRAIKEAIQETMKPKTGDAEHPMTLEDSDAGSDTRINTSDEEADSDCSHVDDSDGDDDGGDDDDADDSGGGGDGGGGDDDDDDDEDGDDDDDDDKKRDDVDVVRVIRSHSRPGGQDVGARNRLRQRPMRNTALDIVVLPDSDDGNTSGNSSS